VVLGETSGKFELDFLTMKEGGLDAVFFNLPMLSSETREQPVSELILEDARTVLDEVERYGNLAEIAVSPDDVMRLHQMGKRAVLFGVETADPFGGDVGTLALLYDAGIRMITLPSEAISTLDPEQDDSTDFPLNDFGLRVVEEMNRLGMIIDITHTSDRLQMDIIRASSKPVVASHSCTRALNDRPREMADSVIRALADKDGVISVTFFPGHISSHFPDSTVTVADLVDHIDHIVEIVGADHVGFGSDFLGSEQHTAGLESATGLPSITYTLLERGYSPADIERMLGGNLMRVFREVQETGS
jgi:membrane dipeptidase